MHNNLAPYPVMKSSGVDWLGDVPKHWDIQRLGNLLRERGELNQTGEITHVLSLLRKRGVIPYDEKGNIGNKKSEDITRYKIVRPNDIVMNCMNIIIGSVGIASEVGCLSPVYYVLVKRDNDHSHYLNAIFQCPSFHKSLIRIGNGILIHRMRIPMELLKCEIFPRPPLPEQTAIVRYLNYINQHIQQLTQAKKKLIDLLTEQKQAIIHHTVTRGLNPIAPLKPSGVKWLGEVPKHWEVRRLRNIAKMQVSSVDKHQKEGEQSIRLCNYVDVYKNDYIDQSIQFMKATATSSEIERFKLQEGDVLITKDSETWDDIAVPALVTESANDLICGYHLALLRPFANKLLGSYLLRALQSNGVACQFHIVANGVTRYGLSNIGIKSIVLPTPPLPEQTAIAEYIDNATADIDKAITAAHREITLLTEYRTRLTTDIVTGKLDVRKAAAELPDEVDTT